MIRLDWRAEQLGASGFGVDFDCMFGGITQPHHEPIGMSLGRALQVADCARCHKTIVRPARAPAGMEYRWGHWIYAIEEEP